MFVNQRLTRDFEFKSNFQWFGGLAHGPPEEPRYRGYTIVWEADAKGMRARSGAAASARSYRCPTGEGGRRAAATGSGWGSPRQVFRSATAESVTPKKPAPHLMRGAQRFSERIMLRQ